jgi:hypothetical protein
MAGAQEELVTMQRLASGLATMSCALVLGGGCSHAPAPGEGARWDGACPTVASASAWINRMPGPGSRAPQLIVMVQLAEKVGGALVPGLSSSDALELSLDGPRTGGAQPGVRYAVPAPDVGPRRILIRCNGAALHAIDSIESVY